MRRLPARALASIHPVEPSGRPDPAALRGGFTLAEAAVAVLLLTVLLSWSSLLLTRQMNRWAVVGAREALAGVVTTARGEALARGGSWVRVEADSGLVVWGAGADTLGIRPLGREWGVDMDATRSLIRYSDLGLGQMASTTVEFTRREARAGVAVSSYGRVRRW